MRVMFLALAAMTGAGPALAGNLVVNGDFSAGNSGFTSGLTLTTSTPYLFQNGQHSIYAVEAIGSVAGSAQYGDWNNVTTDPFGGNGNVFVSDGPDYASPPPVWSETVAVKPNTTYTFSFYGAEISNACCVNAVLLPAINGVSGGALGLDANWQQGTYTWHSGSATSAVLTLTDTSTSGPYNDFVMTDIALTSPVPEPGSALLILAGLAGLGAARKRRAPR